MDYTWWSGLTVTDAKAGLEAVKHKLSSAASDNGIFWFAERSGELKTKTPSAFLLPNYDEYIVSYKDRSVAIAACDIDKADPRGTIFNHTVIINGRIVALWKRTIGKNRIDIEITPFAPLSNTNQASINSAAKRYARFLGVNDVNLNIL